MAQSINTRIILRNADLSAWQKSTTKLLKGEVALAKLPSGNYLLRIGDGEKTWNEISGAKTGQVLVRSFDIPDLKEYDLSSNGTEIFLVGKEISSNNWMRVSENKINLVNSLSDLVQNVSNISANVNKIISFIGGVDALSNFNNDGTMIDHNDIQPITGYLAKSIQKTIDNGQICTTYFINDKNEICTEEELKN